MQRKSVRGRVAAMRSDSPASDSKQKNWKCYIILTKSLKKAKRCVIHFGMISIKIG